MNKEQLLKEQEIKAKSLMERSMRYEVVLSTKERIECEPDELQRVIAGIKAGSMIKLKQGLVNPSFIVTIVRNETHANQIHREIYEVLKNNRQALEYTPHNPSTFRDLPTFRPIKDIFENIQLTANVQIPPNNKQIE